MSAMLACRDGKGGELSSQASKMLYILPGALNKTPYNIRNPSSNQIAGNFLFSSEIYINPMYK